MPEIQVEPHVDKIKMPDNLRIGLLVAKQHEKCNTEGCTFDYYGLGFGQSPFPIPKPISNSLAANADKAHYSDSEGILELRNAISGFNKRHFGLDVDPNQIVIGPGTKDLIHTIFNIISGGVILPSPSWIGYRPQVDLLDKNFHTLKLKPEFNYKINPDELASLVSKI